MYVKREMEKGKERGTKVRFWGWIVRRNRNKRWILRNGMKDCTVYSKGHSRVWCDGVNRKNTRACWICFPTTIAFSKRYSARPKEAILPSLSIFTVFSSSFHFIVIPPFSYDSLSLPLWQCRPRFRRHFPFPALSPSCSQRLAILSTLPSS